MGCKNERVILKNDGEAAIIEVQREIAKRRSDLGSAVENSKVGDSNSNATIERVAQDVEGTVRTFRGAT